MSTNLTIDDTSADIIYSSDWASQDSSTDSDTSKFFGSTYHSAQSNGATANVSFSGSAIYLYGSQGPGHGDYSVQIDNSIAYLSAYAFSTVYQQLLFSYELTDGYHFLSITALTNDEQPWLDIDYITLTLSSNDSVPSAASTVATLTASQTLTPPWMSEEAIRTGSTSTSTAAVTTTSASSETSSTSSLAFVLAVVFGSLIAGALLVVFIIMIFRWRRRDGYKGGDSSEGGMGSATGHRSLLSLGLGVAGSSANALFNRNKRPASPSFMAGPKSPYSPIGLGVNQFYPAQSPASQIDPFHRSPTPLEKQELIGGRKSPFSNLSHGTGTVFSLANNSTTNLLTDKGVRSPPAPTSQLDHSVGLDPGRTTPTEAIEQVTAPAVSLESKPPTITLQKPLPLHTPQGGRDSSVPPNFGLFSCDTKSMAGSGIGTLVPEYTAFSDPLEQLRETEKSEEPFSPLTQANVVANAKAEIPATPTPVAFPLSPSRRDIPEATYYDDPNKYNRAGKRKSQKPPRPKRQTGDGLLEWLGNGIQKGLERSTSWKRKRDDANSSRSDFLKV